MYHSDLKPENIIIVKNKFSYVEKKQLKCIDIGSEDLFNEKQVNVFTPIYFNSPYQDRNNIGVFSNSELRLKNEIF